MTKRLIYCRISMGKPDNRDEDSEIARLRGRSRPSDYWGKATLDLEEVFALTEYYPALDDEDTDLENLEGDLEAGPECNVHFKNGLTWGVQIPYDEMKALLREYRGEDKTEDKPIDVGHAVATLARALDEDRGEDSLYYGYQDKIASAIQYAYRKSTIIKDPLFANIHNFSNDAAKEFLDRLINSVK